MYNRQTSLRLIGTIFVSQSLLSAAQIAIFTLLTIMAAEISGQDSLAGIPATITTLSVAVASVPISLIMAKFGRRIGLTLSYAVSILGAVLGVIAIIQGLFWLLVVSASAIGLGRAGANQSRFIAGDLFYENERGRMIGLIVFAGTMGAIFGPLLVTPGTWLSNYFQIDSNTGPWVIAIIFYTLATLFTFILLRPEPMKIAEIIDADEKKRKKKKFPDGADNDAGRSIRELLSLPRVQLAVISMLLSQVVMVTLMVMTPLHMSHNGHSAGNVGIVISAHTMGMFGFSWLTGYLIDRFGRVPMMVAAAITLIASAIVAPLGTSMPFLVTGLFLLGLGWNFGYVAGSSLLSDALEGAEKSRMQGANDMMVAAAAALGSFSSGPLFATGGYATIAALGIVIAVLFIWIIRLLSPAETQFHSV